MPILSGLSAPLVVFSVSRVILSDPLAIFSVPFVTFSSLSAVIAGTLVIFPDPFVLVVFGVATIRCSR